MKNGEKGNISSSLPRFGEAERDKTVRSACEAVYWQGGRASVYISEPPTDSERQLRSLYAARGHPTRTERPATGRPTR